MKRRSTRMPKQCKRVCTPIETLQFPNEIWSHIGSFLDESSLIALRCSCRFLSHAVEWALVRVLARRKLVLLQEMAKRTVPLETWKWTHKTLQWSRREILDWAFGNLLGAGQLAVCKWLHHVFQFRAKEGRIHNNTPLHACAAGGHLSTLQWLHSVFAYTDADARTGILSNAAASGNVTVCEWIHTTFKLYDTKTLALQTAVCALCAAAEHGNLEACKWVHTTFSLTAHNTSHLNEVFGGAANGGHIEVCCWLGETFNLSAEDMVGAGLFPAACSGQLGLSAWLYSIAPTKAEAAWNHVFCNGAAQYGQLHICKWMHTVCPLDRTDEFLDWALYSAVEGCSLAVCEWLYTTFSVTVEELCRDDLDLVCVACGLTDMDICKWFYGLIPNEIHAQRERLLRTTCTQHAGVYGCMWLHSVLTYTKQEVQEWHILEKALLSDHSDTALWLCDTFHLCPKECACYQPGTHYHTLLQESPRLTQTVEGCVKIVCQSLSSVRT